MGLDLPIDGGEGEGALHLTPLAPAEALGDEPGSCKPPSHPSSNRLLSALNVGWLKGQGLAFPPSRSLLDVRPAPSHL